MAKRRSLFWHCTNLHARCAAYQGGPCNQKQTNSNPKTLARQKKRKKRS